MTVQAWLASSAISYLADPRTMSLSRWIEIRLSGGAPASCLLGGIHLFAEAVSHEPNQAMLNPVVWYIQVWVGYSDANAPSIGVLEVIEADDLRSSRKPRRQKSQLDQQLGQQTALESLVSC